MSLIKQIWIAIATMMAIAFAGAIVVKVLSARHYLEQEIRVKNIDNATALALSLSQLPKDDATVELQVAAQFDAGHYRFIRVVSPMGKVLAERASEEVVKGVPGWFVALIPISAPPGQAKIQDGWKQFGSVSIASQEQFAYLSLWRGTLGLAWGFFLGALVAGAAGTLFVRVITRPLSAVVDQARALAERRFVTMPEPRTPELASMARAMNGLVERLRSMFSEEAARLEALRRRVNHDALTGLASRVYFLSHLREVLLGEQSAPSGSLLFVRLLDLNELNRRLGRPGADDLLKHVAEEIGAWGEGRAGQRAGRINAGEFAVICPALDSTESVEGVALDLHRWLMERVQPRWIDKVPDLLHLSAVRYRRGQDPGELLSRANEALAQAALKGPNGWFAVEDGGGQPALPTEQWRTLLTEAVQGGRLSLNFFPVVSGDGAASLHREGVIRLRVEGQDALLPAGDFMPMAAQLNLTAPIDLGMVKLAIEHLRKGAGDVAVNLSAQTIADFHFRTELMQLLKGYPDLCKRLLFEVPEYGVFQQFDAFRELSRTLKTLGARVGIEYFGQRFAQSDQLADLGLDYIKVHPAYIRGVASNPGNQEFLRGLCKMAHALGITVVALGVEDPQDLPLLASLGFDGATGPGVR